jgi:hypothetical protein
MRAFAIAEPGRSGRIHGFRNPIRIIGTIGTLAPLPPRPLARALEMAAASADNMTGLFRKEFDITGRPMKGWVLVEAEGVEDDDQLKGWIQRAMKFVRAAKTACYRPALPTCCSRPAPISATVHRHALLSYGRCAGVCRSPGS